MLFNLLLASIQFLHVYRFYFSSQHNQLSRLTDKVINIVIITILASIADTNDATAIFTLVTRRKTKIMEKKNSYIFTNTFTCFFFFTYLSNEMSM